MGDHGDARGIVHYLVLNQTDTYSIVKKHTSDGLHKSTHGLDDLGHCRYGLLINLSDGLDRHACYRRLAIVWLDVSRRTGVAWRLDASRRRWRWLLDSALQGYHV